MQQIQICFLALPFQRPHNQHQTIKAKAREELQSSDSMLSGQATMPCLHLTQGKLRLTHQQPKVHKSLDLHK